jgi:hypothetical protein
MKGQTMVRSTFFLRAAILVMGSLLAMATLAAAQDATLPPPTEPTDGGPTWESLTPAELLALARQLTGDDPEVRQARLRIADHVTATYLKDSAPARTVTCQEWKGFAECLVEGIDGTVAFGGGMHHLTIHFHFKHSLSEHL